MTETTKTAASDLDAAAIAHLKILTKQRERPARSLLKRRRKKSHQ
jgi:hypothetical protein